MSIMKERALQGLQGLRSQAVQALDEAEAINAQAEADDRALSAEEQEQYDQLVQYAADLKDQYEAEEKRALFAAQRTAVDDLRAGFNAVPSVQERLSKGVVARVSVMRERWQDDPKRGFASLGHFCADVYNAGLPNMGPSDNLQRLVAAATGMNQQQGALGGFALPPAFSTNIYDGFATSPKNLMALCDVYPVTGESLTFPRNPETSRATGSRYGGVRGYWINEAQQITSSAPKLGQLKLSPIDKELAVLVYVTDRLLRNAGALETYVRRAAGEEIMWLVNDAILRGTGAGQPLGLLNAGATVSVAKESGQAAATLELENINKMVARLHPSAEDGAVWFRNKDTETELEQLAAAVGTGGIPVFLASPTGYPNVAERRQERLKGMPIQTVEWCATLGTVGDLILANLKYYAMGVQASENGQGQIQEAMSMHLRFDYAETAFRFMFGCDGQPWHTAPITPGVRYRYPERLHHAGDARVITRDLRLGALCPRCRNEGEEEHDGYSEVPESKHYRSVERAYRHHGRGAYGRLLQPAWRQRYRVRHLPGCMGRRVPPQSR